MQIKRKFRSCCTKKVRAECNDGGSYTFCSLFSRVDCFPITVTSYLSELEEYTIIFRCIRSGILFFIDYNRIIPKQQEQAKWGERLGYSKEITADKGNRKNREESQIQ